MKFAISLLSCARSLFVCLCACVVQPDQRVLLSPHVSHITHIAHDNKICVRIVTSVVSGLLFCIVYSRGRLSLSLSDVFVVKHL